MDILPESAYDSVLEVGCCTGNLTEKLCNNKPVKVIYCNDLVPEFEVCLRNRCTGNDAAELRSYFGDIESLAIPDGISLLVSGATFQWLSDLPGFIERLQRELNSGSWLAFSIFTTGTLRQFSAVSGIALDYITDDALKRILATGFDLFHFTHYTEELYFSTVREVLQHIRDTGVGGVREQKWSKKSLQNFEREYWEKFSIRKKVPVSYSASCYVLRRK